MWLRLPRLLRLVILLLALLSLITAGISYGVQAAQPTPLCLLYQTNVDEFGYSYNLMLYDPRTEQATSVKYNDYAYADFPSNRISFAPDHSVFVYFAPVTNSAGPYSLYVGRANSSQLRLIATESAFSGDWSPDSATYGFVFYDGQANYIATIDRFGTHKRVRILNGIGDAVVWFNGWSADSGYILLSTLNTTSYYFVATDTLQLVSTTIPKYYYDYRISSELTWSPQGHRFAYIDLTASPLYLVIATPEQGTERNFPLSTPNESSASLVWSPDGRYVAVNRIGRDSHWDYWTYSIFGVDGSVRTSLKGHMLHHENSDAPNGWWSADSSTWLFRQHLYKNDIAETDEAIFSYVVAYHVDTGVEQILADHVASSPLLTDTGNSFAVPMWNKGKLDIGLFSIDGNLSTTLVSGAAGDSMPRLEWSATSNQGTVAAIWKHTTSTGKQTELLTWAHTDGSNRHTIDQDFDEIIRLYWLDDRRSLVFLSRKGSRLSGSVVDLETGKLQVEIDGLVDWRVHSFDPERVAPHVVSSPSGQMAILTSIEDGYVSVYIISLVDKHIQHIRFSADYIGDVIWSPDSASFAFIRWDWDEPSSKTTLQIVSADGRILHQETFSNGGVSDLRGWAWCK